MGNTFHGDVILLGLALIFGITFNSWVLLNAHRIFCRVIIPQTVLSFSILDVSRYELTKRRYADLYELPQPDRSISNPRFH